MSSYKERVSQGLCGKCGNPRNAESKSLCDNCREKERKRAAKRREESKANGLCGSCGSRPCADGKRRCEVCLAGSAASTRRASRRRKAAGLCQTCGKPPIPGKTVCQTCSDNATKIAAARYHQRRQDGKCSYCDNDPAEGSTMCSYHIEQTRQQRETLKREIMEAYGGCKCSHCEESDLRFLEVDHINGGGRKHLREEVKGSGHSFYQWLKRNNFPKGFRVLCRTCNSKAHVDRCRENDKNLNETH